jgi:hypothetical protein
VLAQQRRAGLALRDRVGLPASNLLMVWGRSVNARL